MKLMKENDILREKHIQYWHHINAERSNLQPQNEAQRFMSAAPKPAGILGRCSIKLSLTLVFV